jgi:hypothetical protein
MTLDEFKVKDTIVFHKEYEYTSIGKISDVDLENNTIIIDWFVLNNKIFDAIVNAKRDYYSIIDEYIYLSWMKEAEIISEQRLLIEILKLKNE